MATQIGKQKSVDVYRHMPWETCGKMCQAQLGVARGVKLERRILPGSNVFQNGRRVQTGRLG